MSFAAHSALRSILTLGTARSRYQEYLATDICFPEGGSSFYLKTLTEKGASAAEATLVEWEQAHRCSDFAAAIEPTVRGLYALAYADTEGKYVETGSRNQNKHLGFPRLRGASDEVETVFALNPELPTAHDAFLPASALFGRNRGHLGLRGFTLQVGRDDKKEGRFIQLGLVIQPIPSLSSDKEHRYTLFTIEPSGATASHHYRSSVDIETTVRRSLGITPTESLDRPLGTKNIYSYVHNEGRRLLLTGFSDAHDALANDIEKLGRYLILVARTLYQPPPR